jgi:malate dehydrogenase (oxaloacetate-decarboxylating)
MLYAKNIRLKTVRLRNQNKPGVLGRVLSLVGEVQALVGEIRTIHYGSLFTIRDIDILYESEQQLERFLELLSVEKEVTLLEVRDEVLAAHLGGKLRVVPTMEIQNLSDLRRVYTPGVANVVELIHRHPDSAHFYTWSSQTVAVISNGSRVLGLGNVGPRASLPVMEGKAMLMAQFVRLSAVPIVLKTRDVKKFVDTVLEIEEGFSAIHLEDIETPQCFEIEDALKKALKKPVMHDDQHGTAVAALAALISACERVGRDPRSVRVGAVGLGAAGSAIGRLILRYTGNPVIGYDIQKEARERFLKWGGEIANSIEEVFQGTDVIVSTTGVKNLIQPRWIRTGQIIMAISNPYPEIEPEEAKKAGASFAVDGRSLNNLLGYPGIFRGAIDTQSVEIHPQMLISAAEAIAHHRRNLELGGLLPSPLDRRLHWDVARAVARAAVECGVARYSPPEDYFQGEEPQTFWSLERAVGGISIKPKPIEASQPQKI